MRGRAGSDDSVDRWSRYDWWGVVLDAPDAPALAHFYSDLLGWEIASESPEDATLGPSSGVAYLAIQTSAGYVRPTWPNVDQQQQMMMHLDFQVSDLDAAVAHAIELGAEEAEHQPQDDVRVMLDPAGHPFCLYTDKERT
jgi:catechol 2,3-dioxygenase-like lactoylglutathione lyase family enzyme